MNGDRSMKVERPNARELTSIELEELEALKRLVEKAIADGIVSSNEREQIRALTLGNNPGPELLYEKLLLLRQLVTEKVNQGLLVAEGPLLE